MKGYFRKFGEIQGNGGIELRGRFRYTGKSFGKAKYSVPLVSPEYPSSRPLFPRDMYISLQIVRVSRLMDKEGFPADRRRERRYR